MNMQMTAAAGGDQLKAAEKRLTEYIKRRAFLIELHSNLKDIAIDTVYAEDGERLELNLEDLRLVLNL